MSRPLQLVLLATLSLVTPIAAATAQPMPASIAAAVNDMSRPAADKMRDANRKPAESVAFAQVKPGDKVVDFIAGGGYFTRILSKAVGPMGHVYATVPGAMPMGGAAMPAANNTMPMGNAMPQSGGTMPMGNMPTGNSTMPMGNAAMPAAGGMPMSGMGGEADIKAIAANPAYANVSVLVQPASKLMVPEPVDVVWTAQNYHDLHNPGPYHADDMAAFNKSVFDALKPGGVFLVIDYAAAPGTGFMQTQGLHRADPEAEKAEIMKAGFVFEGESKVLARPTDMHMTRSHEQDDQFMFRFRKPK